MVGLGNVDNTSDANKPISSSTQSALDLKAVKSDTDASFNTKQDNLTFGINDTNAVKIDGTVSTSNYLRFTEIGVEGRTGVQVKSDIGLSNVDNTADADKPISTSTLAKFTTTQASITTLHNNTDASFNLKADKDLTDASFNTKQDNLSFGIINGNTVIMSADAGPSQYPRFTNSGIEGRTI